MRPSSTLEGKIALVTGAARRVGRAISLALAEAGADVAVHYSRSDADAATLAEEIRSGGGRASLQKFDLGRPEGAEELYRKVIGEHGRIDILVNNASSWAPAPLDDLTIAEIDEAFGVNLRSPFWLAVLCGRSMRSCGAGAIVNILDWSIARPYPAFVPYGIAKAGLAAATRGLARAFAPEVRVNAVAPGTVLLPDGMPAEQAERIRRAIPMGRIGTPEDVAAAVVFLAHAPYVTGVVLPVDGGRMLR